MASVQIVDPCSDRAWAELSKHGSIFASPPWLRAIAETYGFDVRAMIASDEHGAVAGLPFVAVDDGLGRRVVALPFSDYCDPIGSDPRCWQAIADALLGFEASVRLRCLHASEPREDKRFELTTEAAWHAVDITRPAEQIWTSLTSSARRNIRKARARELTVRVADDTAAVALFHELHSEVRSRKYGLLAQPLAFFQNLRAAFTQAGAFSVLLAEADNRPVAATVYLGWQDTLYYKFNASRTDALDLRPNDLLVWAGIEHGQTLGLSRLDFGLSDLEQPGLISFKEKYASERSRISCLKDVRDHRASPHAREIRELLGSLTELVTADGIPLELTRRAGDRLYRYFA